MKLKTFRIKNYKSIVDSGECFLSKTDNIAILAGQNESGKSSILQALRDFHKDAVSSDAVRIENEIPEIQCTYILTKEDTAAIVQDVKNKVELPSSIENFLRGLDENTFIRTFDDLTMPTLQFSEEITMEIQNVIDYEKGQLAGEGDEEELEQIEEDEETEEVNKPMTVLSDDFLWNIIETIDNLKPRVIFFDDFCDLLPDKILVNDLAAKNEKANGYQAVKNIEVILKDDLTKLDKLADPQRNKAEARYHKSITANFNEKWTQRVGDNNQAKIYIQYNQGRIANSAYLNFFIETKDQEYLPPRQRSQGFRWFLSFYLHLKAESERNSSLIILFDEPGLFLHSKAQNDMVKVFEELAEKNQIIYSTHSPYLIDTSKLHRIRLVLNTTEDGTTIEKITTNKIKDQKDALKPIIDAVGLEVAHNFSVAKKRNVLLEGISDFYYLEAFRKLLNKKGDYSFIPAMGYSNVHLLMELCIGWGLQWLIVFDEKGITREYNKIKKAFFNNDENDIKKKIMKLTGFDGIEELFDNADFDKILPGISLVEGQKKGVSVSENGGKELAARLFLEKVSTGQLKKENFSDATIGNFEKIFSFISQGFE